MRAEIDDGRGPERDVQQVTRHREVMSFRALCEQVLRPETRYLLLDLDRTVHLGINMGEMLGWELCAWNSYDFEDLQRLEPDRGTGRVVLDWSRPTGAARFIYFGLRDWGGPGLHYWLWGKMASRIPWLHRIASARFGPRPVQHAQRTTQLTLMNLLREVDPALVRKLAQRVWDRHTGRQVITRADLDWVRTRCPDVEIILTSASPKPTVELAAQMLGIDLCAFSTLDRINSGEEKVLRLRELRPDILDGDVVTAGITDTQYGEDHCWAKYFDTVVDINSSWPFPGSVPADSAVREVHSAQVLTQHESERRAAGESEYLDALRPREPMPRGTRRSHRPPKVSTAAG